MIVKNLLIFECLLKLSYRQDIEKRIYYNTLIVTTTTRKKTTNKTTTKQPQKHVIDKNVGQYTYLALQTTFFLRRKHFPYCYFCLIIRSCMHRN